MPARLDRLSAFLAAFALQVQPVPAGRGRPAHLFLLAGAEPDARRVAFRAAPLPRPRCEGRLLLAADVGFGGASNPLLRSLPEELVVEARAGDPIWALAEQLITEARVPRCGGPAALARLGELLVLMLLREAIDRGATQPGLLAGLAHARLRHAVGAMLQQPGQPWRVDELAALCSLSRSQFMLAFRRTLGMTPGTFLAGWRLTLARGQLERGDRVKAVAARCGYGSAAAFSRAYARAFGHPPAAASSLEAGSRNSSG